MSFFRRLAVFLLVMFFCANAFKIYSFADAPLSTSAKSAILTEAKTGEVLYEKNAYQKMPMASTTKIMTAICAIENGNLDEVVTVDSRAAGIEGSSMYLKNGEKITLRNLLYGLMLSSGNDAAVAIALNVGKSVENFADMMNETAKKIGVKDTSFKNPNGLDEEGHYTTAYDLAQITRYALSNSEFAKIVSTNEITLAGNENSNARSLRNHNKLLRIYDGATGVKTGFTKKSGRCLVSSSERNGINLIAVTLNDPNDWNDHISMFNYAFDNCKMKSVVKKGEYAGTVNVKSSPVEGIKTEYASDTYALFKNNENDDITVKTSVANTVEAPVDFGVKIGESVFFSNGKKLGSADIVTSSCAAKEESNKLYEEFKNILIKYIWGI